jgi:hypothetical protein
MLALVALVENQKVLVYFVLPSSFDICAKKEKYKKRGSNNPD